MSKSLIFVYNAENGFFNKLTDYAHKLISPQTYACNLCAITYSNLGIRKEWKEFIDKLDVKAEFYYRDDILDISGIGKTHLPAIFLKSGNNFELLVDATSINSCRNVANLKKLILDNII